MEGQHPTDHQVAGRLQTAALRVHKVVQIVHVRKGQHQIVPLQPDLHRVHKAVLIVQGQMRLAGADPIVPVRRVQEYLNLRQIVAVAPFHLGLRWVAPVIPRDFVHELLNL